MEQNVSEKRAKVAPRPPSAQALPLRRNSLSLLRRVQAQRTVQPPARRELRPRLALSPLRCCTVNTRNPSEGSVGPQATGADRLCVLTPLPAPQRPQWCLLACFLLGRLYRCGASVNTSNLSETGAQQQRGWTACVPTLRLPLRPPAPPTRARAPRPAAAMSLSPPVRRRRG